MKRLMIVALLAALVMVLASSVAFALVGSIKNTKHDLSSGTTAAIRSNEDEICVFCHTPHNATRKVPLWNHTVTSSSFTTYFSTTIDGATNLVKGDASTAASVSVLCLSCHDGSVALGSVVKNYSGAITINDVPGKVTGGVLVSAAALGTDLSNDHPVGITYKTDVGDLRSLTGTKVVDPLDPTKFCQLFGTSAPYTVECASCHAVHGGTTAEPFLRFSNANSRLCLACHLK